jgi:hypothetical protein
MWRFGVGGGGEFLHPPHDSICRASLAHQRYCAPLTTPHPPHCCMEQRSTYALTLYRHDTKVDDADVAIGAYIGQLDHVSLSFSVFQRCCAGVERHVCATVSVSTCFSMCCCGAHQWLCIGPQARASACVRASQTFGTRLGRSGLRACTHPTTTEHTPASWWVLAQPTAHPAPTSLPIPPSKPLHTTLLPPPPPISTTPVHVTLLASAALSAGVPRPLLYACFVWADFVKYFPHTHTHTRACTCTHWHPQVHSSPGCSSSAPALHSPLHDSSQAFDCTRKVTYQNLTEWYKELRIYCEHIPVIVVANKIDVDYNVSGWWWRYKGHVCLV